MCVKYAMRNLTSLTDGSTGVGDFASKRHGASITADYAEGLSPTTSPPRLRSSKACARRSPEHRRRLAIYIASIRRPCLWVTPRRRARPDQQDHLAVATAESSTKVSKHLYRRMRMRRFLSHRRRNVPGRPASGSIELSRRGRYFPTTRAETTDPDQKPPTGPLSTRRLREQASVPLQVVPGSRALMDWVGLDARPAGGGVFAAHSPLTAPTDALPSAFAASIGRRHQHGFSLKRLSDDGRSPDAAIPCLTSGSSWAS